MRSYEALLDALCEETITPEQLQRLETLVLTHPEAEACYVQFMSLHADLIGHFGVLSAGVERSLEDGSAGPARTEPEQPLPGATNPTPVAVSLRSSLRFWRTIGVLALAASLLLVLASWQWRHKVPSPAEPEPEATDQTVAVLLQAPDARWEETGLPTWAGAPLPPGWLRLKSGLAQVEFYSGAMVILEGPAELQLISRTEAYCARGKLRATVPPQAQGFTIRSPKLELVDRGTEFGLEVGRGDRTEVHVFQGKVDLYDAGSNRADGSHKALTTGQGLRLSGRGVEQRIESKSTAFRTAQELAARARAETRRRQEDWAAACTAVRRDPSLVLFYTFQPEGALSRTLRDQPGVGQQPHDGAIVGCSWVTGRWPGKQGLEFKRVSDRVRLNVPGDFESVTLAAWVRVDGLPNRNNSLLMADAWPEGGLHWQIGDDGTIILGIKSPGKEPNAHYRAREAFGPERFGRWSHLAVVYDRDASLVTHYLDGHSIAQLPVQIDTPLHVGSAEIGNWNFAGHRPSVPIRFLTGCIDEFLLFSRALSDEEIEQTYERGRPPL